MTFAVPLGESDFRLLRAQGTHYVDKTPFVGEVLANPAKVMLFLRPRRFGKTLNLSTLRWFLENNGEPIAPAFDGLKIWDDPMARQHFQRFPVISLTFKDVKANTYDRLEQRLITIIAAEVRRHAELASSPALQPMDRDLFARMGAGRANASEYESALLFLSQWLEAHSGQPAVILIDEYDAPIHVGVMHGFADRILDFFRNFLSAGLKDNPHLHKGVLTGVLRIAKESLFSGLNNLAIYGPTQREFGTAFGFTGTEVADLLAQAGCATRSEEIAEWYDGYSLAEEPIYNPWSILSFLHSADRVLRPHWVATGSDDLLRQILLDQGLGLRPEMAALLEGAAITVPIEESTALRDLADSEDAVWSFLVHTGYLTAEPVQYDESGQPSARVRIPNREVRSVYIGMLSRWLGSRAGGEGAVRELVRAMFAGNAAAFQKRLSELVLSILSFHMTGGDAPERVYHAFLLGLLARLEGEFEVRSERESGHGRADILVLPRRPGEPGVAMELKRMEEGDKPEKVLDAALAQLHARDYAAELRARGANPISLFAIAFDAKAVHVRPG